MTTSTPPTLYDVARRAGVSHMTVSRVFTGKGQVAAKTRDRILEVAEALRYRPNVLASGLRGARTRSVAVVWQFVDPWAGDASIGLWIMQQLQLKGIATYQAQYWPEEKRMVGVLDDLLNRKIDGLILFCDPQQMAHPAIRHRLDRIAAVVSVSYTTIADFAGDQIVHDRNQAIVQIVEHLAKTGRRRPAFMTSLELASNHEKWHTFQHACRERGIADHPHQLLEMAPPEVSADRPFMNDAERYLAVLNHHFPKGRPIDVDAIFSFNDVGAMVSANWLKHRGLRVPEDVAVIGFNNSEAAELWDPPLASGDRCRQQVAEAAHSHLMQRIAEPDLPARVKVVPMQFIWRQSAGGTGRNQ